MQRVFIRDHGRFKAGEVRDYPRHVWEGFFPGFESFTLPVSEAVRNAVAASNEGAAIPDQPVRRRKEAA